MSAGTSYAIHGCKLFAKSSNYPSVAKFSSTLDETYLLLVANNCNNYFYNDDKNASVLGTSVTNTGTRPLYETYIGSKINSTIDKIATFNENEIFLNKTTNISGDFLPTIDENYDLGSETKKWKDLYLSGTTAKIGQISLKTDNNSLLITKDGKMSDLRVKNVKIPVSEDSFSKYVSVSVNDNNKLILEAKHNENLIETINISQMNTDTMIEGSNLFFTWERAGLVSYSSNQETSNYAREIVEYTSNEISTRITNLNADEIADGISQRFIINDTYDTNLNILGTLTTSNLNVIGETTIVETTEYNAEKMHIIHDDYDGPALRIDHYTNVTDEIMSTWKFDSGGTSNPIMMIKNNVNHKPIIGIGIENPQHTIDVDGDINAIHFIGNGKYLNEVNLEDRNSDMLAEGLGSNFYYTDERRIGMSNYVYDVREELWNQVTKLTLDQVHQGTSNKYIINDVYSSDLYVAGKLMVTGIDIVDLDYIMSREGTLSSAGNIYDYVSTLTSNTMIAVVSQEIDRSLAEIDIVSTLSENTVGDILTEQINNSIINLGLTSSNDVNDQIINYLSDNNSSASPWNDNTDYISYSSKVLIGNGVQDITPNGVLHISNTSVSASANSGSIVLDYNETHGSSSIIFRSKEFRENNYGYIEFSEYDNGTFFRIGSRNINSRNVEIVHNNGYCELKTNSGTCSIGKDTSVTLDVTGNNEFDSMTKLRVINNSQIYGRSQIQIVGRFENGNDAWNLSTGRCNLIFSLKTSTDSPIFDQNAIQSFAGNLGFFTNASMNFPQVEIRANGNNYQRFGSPYWASFSDERIKEEITEADYAKCYENIDKLSLKRFKFKDGVKNLTSNDKYKLGYIAQEVQEIFPKNVNTSSIKIENENETIDINDCLSIDIEQINMSLHGCVKFLINENNQLKERISNLEKIINI